MQGSLPVLLTIEIVDYDKKGQAVYYYIEIFANNTKKWKIERRFKDIEEMHKKLAKKLDDIPYLPAKSFFQISGDALEKRKDDLEKYFNTLASRGDVLSDSDFKDFFEIDKHIKLDHLTKVKKISEIQNLPKGVRDFIYLPQKGILVLLLAETSTFSKLGTMISNFSNMKSKEEMSSVILYKEEPLNSLEFTRVWKKSFDIEASAICIDQTSPYLAVGFANGFITCLKLSSHDNYTTQQEYCKIHCHNHTVTGMIVLPDTGHLISCSMDKFLIKTDVNENDGKLSDKTHSYPLTSMLYDTQNRRAFVGDLIGSIFIYDPHNKMELVHAIHFPKENLVKALFFDPLRNMLLSGSTQGVITIYEIGRPGKEKLSTITGTFDTLKNVRGIFFNPEAKEIYVANGSGNVAFVNTLTTSAFHVFEAHSDSLSKMVYLENKKLMITGGGDKLLKFWRYPYDPKEKLTQKIIDHNGTVLASSDPVQQYKVQKRQEANEKPKKEEKYNKNNNDDEEDEDRRGSSPRGPLNLLKYQPAMEVNSDDDEDHETAQKKEKPQTKVKKEPVKPEKSSKKQPKKENSDNEDDDDNDNVVRKKKDDRDASPKSFLFKNSVEQSVKKTGPQVPKKQEEEQKEVISTKEEVQNKSKTNQQKVSETKDFDQEQDKDKEVKKAVKKDLTQEKNKANTVEVKQKEKANTSDLSKDTSTKSSTVIKFEGQTNYNVDDDKPLNIDELKKTSSYVPLTFKKKAGDSDDEELSGWNS